MKLNKKFIGINYHLTPVAQRMVIDVLMSPESIGVMVESGVWGPADLKRRKDLLEELHKNENHKLYYISRKVQEHSDLIKFDKIKLAWFRNVRSQSSTYFISKNEFFKFIVKQGKEIYVLHFYRDPNISDDFVNNLIKSNYPLAEFYGYKFDIFAIYIDEEKYPDGFMPDNSFWGQDPLYREIFLKLMLFIELSEPEVVLIKNNGKVSVTNGDKSKDEHKIKNESGVNVTLINTLWNKVIINNSGFSVKGHIRIQPYGPGRQHYKPIWIEEFQKKGYVRGLSKLNDEDDFDS